ncbi:MAG: FKBP-type peptidyl-prolyl cis-trans isomerase [Candidatus Saccharimonadales bacterium]
MTKVRDRAFAWVGIVIFTVSALALSAAVIIQQFATSNSTPASKTTQTCSDTSAEPTITPPTPFIPSGPVSSLQVTNPTVGTGQTAQSGDCLVVKYYGTLATTGKVFDENFTQPVGFAFTLTQGQVIQGWVEGLQGMKIGGIRRLVIPASLAYGSQATSGIPANSALVFVVKLLSIQS